MAGLPGEGYATVVGKFLELWLVRIGLKNAPDMKERDKALKDQQMADRIDREQKEKDEKKSREDWG